MVKRRNKMRYTVLPAITLGLCLLGSTLLGVHAANPDKARTVRVGFFTFDGYHMVDKQGKRSGYGYDYLQYLARYTNFNYEYIGYDKSWSEMQDMLENGDIDLLTSAQKTEERMERFDFSNQPAGESSAILTVKAGDDRYMVNDYAKLNGIRVGLLEGNSRNQSLEQFASEAGFTYQPVYYKDNQTLTQALQDKNEIDAVMTSNLRRIKDEWIVATFDTESFYIMVRKGDRQLLDEVNKGMTRLQLEHRNLPSTLFERYYTPDNGDAIAYTAEEREYIKARQDKGSKLKVAISSGREPVAYFVDGEARGIIPDIAKEVLDRTEIPYQLINTLPGEDPKKALKEKKVEVRFDGIADFNDAEEQDLRMTDTYLKLPLSVVTRKNYSDQPSSVAVVGSSPVVERYAKEVYGEDALTQYDSAKACMDAVQSGKEDAAFFQTYIAQKLVNEDARSRFKEQLVPGYEMGFAVSTGQENALLFSILDKAVISLGTEETNRIVLKQTSRLSSDVTLLGYLYGHPTLWFLILAVAAGFAIILTLSISRRKNLVLEKEKRQALQDALSSAQRAGEAKSAFMSRMSHEIRTPLNAITGYLSIARGSLKDPDKTEECLDKTEFAAQNLLHIVNDVLDISAIESGRMQIAHEAFHIQKMVEGITSVFEAQAREKKVHFLVHAKDLVQAEVIGDRFRLNQILMNLLSNAIKFTPAGGEVSLTIRQKRLVFPNVYLQFEVADTGIGMTEEYKKRMFQPFEQQDAVTAQKYGGTGLGLSIARNLVSMMNGTIDVQSEEEKGTCFTVNLSFEIAEEPDAEQEEKEERKEKEGLPDEKRLKLKGTRLLMAEDNPLNMEIAKDILSTYGIRIDGAENGQEAAELFERSEEGTYQAILMDIQMPVLNGYKAAEKIRAGSHPQAGTIPIIALTADAFAEDVNHALSVGMNSHVSKPVDFDQLCRVIARYL